MRAVSRLTVSVQLGLGSARLVAAAAVEVETTLRSDNVGLEKWALFVAVTGPDE